MVIIKIDIISEWNIASLKTNSKEKYILISISSKRDYIFEFRPRNNFIECIELEFDDVSLEMLDDIKTNNKELYEKVNIMSDEQAEEIVKFVLHYLTKVELIVIHCAAGISRSAGIGKALAEWLNGSDDGVIDSKKHMPNNICYSKLNRAIKKLVSQHNK